MATEDQTRTAPAGGHAPWERLHLNCLDADPLETRPWPDAPAEWRALERAKDRGDVSFHDVATAWFHSSWGSRRCPACLGTGKPAAGSSATVCAACEGSGRIPEVEGEKEHWAELFPALLDVFARQRGGLVTCYFCENIRVAAALTDLDTATERRDTTVEPLAVQRDRQRLEHQRAEAQSAPSRRERKQAVRVVDAHDHDAPFGLFERVSSALSRIFGQRAASSAIHLEPIFGDPDSPRAKELLFRCLRLHYHAIEWLKPKPRKICTRMTFNVIANLLGSLDERVGRGESAAEFDNMHADQEVLERELQRTEDYFFTSVQRTARLAYLRGTLVGLIGTAGVILPLALVRPVPDGLALAFMAGAVGALVSVLQRLTSGRLTANHEDGKWTLHLLGFVRPFLGGLFGLALFAFLKADIVTGIEVPDADDPYFLAALGFLAGFSERFAKDALDPAKLLPGVGAAGRMPGTSGVPGTGPRATPPT